MTTLLLVAAEPREFAGLLRRTGPAVRLPWPVDWARAAGCAGRRFVMVANGAGRERAAAAVAAALRRESAAAVVSVGFCGALDPALGAGDVFVATSVAGTPGVFPAAVPQANRPHASGVLASIGRVAQTAAEKAALRAGGAAAVEMEAAGVAEEALRAGLPFYCVRAVTDLAGESFTLDFNRVLQRDGHFDTMLLLGRVVAKPAALPELFRLWRRCRVAAFQLGDFIADCRF